MNFPFLKVAAGVLLFAMLILGGFTINLTRSNNDKNSQITSLKQQLNQKQEELDNLQIQIDDGGKKTVTDKTIDKANMVKDTISEKATDIKTKIGDTINSLKDKLTTKTDVKIYLPKNPENEKDLNYVDGVVRQTDRTDVATFAIEEIVKGPSTKEQDIGFIAPFYLTEDSNCSGKDFTLYIKDYLATFQFCRQLPAAGIGLIARTKSSISKTLKQFSTIKDVKILDKNGTCFGDESGLDICTK